MRTALIIEVTHGRGWGYDPRDWDRSWGIGHDDIECPNRHVVSVPVPAVTVDNSVILPSHRGGTMPFRFIGEGWRFADFNRARATR